MRGYTEAQRSGRVARAANADVRWVRGCVQQRGTQKWTANNSCRNARWMDLKRAYRRRLIAMAGGAWVRGCVGLVILQEGRKADGR